MDELIEGYIEEVKTYIPSLRDGIKSLAANHKQNDVLQEVHRLVHTIKGASSMIGIYGLSQIAFQMEDTLDEVIAGQLEYSEDLYVAMAATIDKFEMYCTDYFTSGLVARDMFREIATAFRLLRNLSVDAGDPDFKNLVESVPEKEGGPKSDEETDIEAIDMEVEGLEDYSDLEGLEGLDEDDDDDDEPENDGPLPELLESFYEEAEQHLDDLDQALNTLEEQIVKPGKMTSSQREIIRQVRRSVHTLKGAAAVIGLPNISGFAHGLEDLLDWFFEIAVNIDPEQIKLLIESVDLLHRLTEDPQNARSDKVESLTQIYQNVMQSEAEPEDEEDEDEEDIEPIPELLESFYEESEQHLQEMSASLNDLEGRITGHEPMSKEVKEIIRLVRRGVHTLKGAAAVIGLKNIATFGHSMEDLLDWIYEETTEINPDIIKLLMESADLLESIVENPQIPQTPRVNALRTQYKVLMEGTSSEEPQEPQEPEPTAFAVSDMEEDSEEEDSAQTQFKKAPARSLRVGMEQIDDLVNLGGELIIALSAFDQKMENLRDTIADLDISRNRLRELSREMEVGYEVKALEGMTAPGGFTNVSQTPETVSNSEFDDFDTLELDRYSTLNLIIRSLNESVIDVGAIFTQLTTLNSDFDGHVTRQRVLLSELQDKMMRVRMTPMSTITNRLRRTVREVAKKLGKKIRLIIDGSEIELDKLVWEKITDPLMHLLRNAADHGIEPPELRQARGKAPVATLKLAASREGNQVVIRISDDGAGLNFDAIKATARKAGFGDDLDGMNEDDLANLIFRPGFSTRGKITEVSGRGVGMDVVKGNIQELKGNVNVTTWPEKGSCFTIGIPLTLAAIRALLFTVGGQTFAISLNEVDEILRIDPESISGELEDVIQVKDEIMPFLHLAEVLGIAKRENTSFATASNPIVLVIKSGEYRGVAAIDDLLGQREIVIKSTGVHLRYVKGISGATIMGDGSVIPILNIQELMRAGRSDTTISIDQGPVQEKPLSIMVVDDSVSIRQVVARLMSEQGWEVQTAKDGIDALERLRDYQPDLIVLDVEMPRMNGYEFLSAKGSESSYKNIPVVMLTSRTATKHRDKAIGLGAKGFIVKPYNDDEFIDLVLKLTG